MTRSKLSSFNSTPFPEPIGVNLVQHTTKSAIHLRQVLGDREKAVTAVHSVLEIDVVAQEVLEDGLKDDIVARRALANRLRGRLVAHRVLGSP